MYTFHITAQPHSEVLHVQGATSHRSKARLLDVPLLYRDIYTTCFITSFKTVLVLAACSRFLLISSNNSCPWLSKESACHSGTSFFLTEASSDNSAWCLATCDWEFSHFKYFKWSLLLIFIYSLTILWVFCMILAIYCHSKYRPIVISTWIFSNTPCHKTAHAHMR